jgi:hypothetical protein
VGLFSTSIEHQDLGTVKKNLFGMWKGSMTLGDQKVEIRLPGSGTEPNPSAVNLLKELPQRFPSLQKEIEKHLYEHYQPYREALDAGEEVAPVGRQFPKIGAPSEVWKWTRPVRVVVESTGPKGKLEIAFEVGWDEEHVVGATVEDWKISAFSGSVAP